jgi:hypothetical protein
MVRAIDIQEKLLHLIGWEQNYDTSDLKISDALTVSESGLYFQQIHPLLTLQNMACIAPDFKNIEFPEYEDKEYSKGNIVSYNGKLYKLIQDSNKTIYQGDEIKNYLVAEGQDPQWQDQEKTGVTEFSGTTRRTDTSYAFNVYIVPELEQNSEFSLKAFIAERSNKGKIKSVSLYMNMVGVSISSEIENYARMVFTWGPFESDDILISGAKGTIHVVLKCDNEVPEQISEELLINIHGIKPVANTESYQIVFRMNDFIAEVINEENTNTFIAPDNSEYWVETNPFSEWLESKTKASIQKAISRYCNEKIAQGTHKTLCENRTLFDGTGRLVDVVKNKKNLVGFEIVPVRAKGVTTKINKIGLQFTEPGEYTLYLMHSSMDAPVKIIKLNKIRKNSIEWFSLNDIYLPYQSDHNDAGGSWYLCYFQSELPEGSQAIRKDKDWSKEPCGSCSRKELLAWQAWSKYIEVHPFFVNEELIEIEEEPHLWDVENNQYTYDNNYGLNLEITISCDITDFIIEQRMLFQDIIAKQVAVDMLREFAYNANVRTNRHSINASRLDILYEVDGDSSSMKKSGLSYQLDMTFKAIKLSTEGIDRVCLPCKNNGIKYRTV